MARGGRVALDQRAIDALASSASVKLLTEACEVVLQGAKRRCPVSPAGSVDPETGVAHPSGYLRSSIKSRVIPAGSQFVGIVGTTTGYAWYVEFGTSPHVIRAKRASVLANSKGDVFGPVVHHPGTKAQPFLRPALDDLAGHTFRSRL